jgi:hypothetical protein
MIAFYGRGRWTAFLSPQTPYESHIALVFHEGTVTPPLPNPQVVIGWVPDTMFELAVQYVNERAEADMKETK